MTFEILPIPTKWFVGGLCKLGTFSPQILKEVSKDKTSKGKMAQKIWKYKYQRMLYFFWWICLQTFGGSPLIRFKCEETCDL